MCEFGGSRRKGGNATGFDWGSLSDNELEAIASGPTIGPPGSNRAQEIAKSILDEKKAEYMAELAKYNAKIRAKKRAKQQGDMEGKARDARSSGIDWSVRGNFGVPENLTFKLTLGAGLGGNAAVTFAQSGMYLDLGFGFVGGVSVRGQVSPGTPTPGLSLNVKAAAALAGGGGELSASTRISNGRVTTVIKPAAGLGFGTSVGATGNVTIIVPNPTPPWSPMNPPRDIGEGFAAWYGLR